MTPLKSHLGHFEVSSMKNFLTGWLEDAKSVIKDWLDAVPLQNLCLSKNFTGKELQLIILGRPANRKINILKNTCKILSCVGGIGKKSS